jgi:hypothetical protein
MTRRRISFEVDERMWREFVALTRETGLPINDQLTSALREYLDRQQSGSRVARHMAESLRRNRRLGEVLPD